MFESEPEVLELRACRVDSEATPPVATALMLASTEAKVLDLDATGPARDTSSPVAVPNTSLNESAKLSVSGSDRPKLNDSTSTVMNTSVLTTPDAATTERDAACAATPKVSGESIETISSKSLNESASAKMLPGLMTEYQPYTRVGHGPNDCSPPGTVQPKGREGHKARAAP